MNSEKRVTRRGFIQATGAASAGLVLHPSSHAAPASGKDRDAGGKKPNILFVFADQLRYSALGSSGNKVVQTPHLDRLAGQGLIFDQAFASHPLCSPYRAHLMTGRYGFKNGVVDNEYKLRDGQVTLAQALKGAGYHTGYVGKWHLGPGPYTKDKRYGFDYMAAYNCQHGYYKTRYYENDSGPMRKMEGWAPACETDLAIKFMQEHNQHNSNSPFALVLAWGPPHWPYDQYPDEYKVYDPFKIELPPNVPLPLRDYARKEIADYYGNITGLDTQMGRLMEVLDRLGLADDTVVCFSSDHGDHLSSHGYGKPMDRWLHYSRRASKSTPYEEAGHIPFILRYPRGIRDGWHTPAMFSSVDVMPTLLGLCGVDVPEGVQGYDLSHVVTERPGPEAPDSVYLMNMGPGWPTRDKWVGCWRGVRNDRWVYARWHNDPDQGPFLFDRKNDPHEMNNLAGKGKYADVEKRMEARLKRWMSETGDPFDTGPRDSETGMLLVGQEFANKEHYDRVREKRSRS